MSIEDAIMGGIVFKGKKDKPKEDGKVKTKAKKKSYITGKHGSGCLLYTSPSPRDRTR